MDAWRRRAILKNGGSVRSVVPILINQEIQTETLPIVLESWRKAHHTEKGKTRTGLSDVQCSFRSHIIAWHDKVDYGDFADYYCGCRAANPQSIRAAERGGRRSEVACAIRGRVGCCEDVLPGEWEADRVESDVQAVHGPGRQVSAVRFHVPQS